MSKKTAWTPDLQHHARHGASLQRVSLTASGQSRQRHRIETELSVVRLALARFHQANPTLSGVALTEHPDYHVYAWALTRKASLEWQLERLQQQRIVE